MGYQDKERYRSLVPMYARCSNVLILVICKEKYDWQESVFIGLIIILNTQQLVVNYLLYFLKLIRKIINQTQMT